MFSNGFSVLWLCELAYLILLKLVAWKCLLWYHLRRKCSSNANTSVSSGITKIFLVVLLPLDGLGLYLLLHLLQVVMDFTVNYFKWSWITSCYNDLICTVNLTSIFFKKFCSEVYKLLLVSCHLKKNFTRGYFPFWLQKINSTGSVTFLHSS